MKVCAWILGAAILAAPPAMAEENASPTPSQAVNVDAPRPAMSTEKLVAMRNALASQVAVYDSVEQTWRRPTPSEQAQLSQGASASGASRVVTLSNGGKAVQGGAAELSFLTVELQPDGTLTTSHMGGTKPPSPAKVPTPRLKTVAAKKGGQDVE